MNTSFFKKSILFTVVLFTAIGLVASPFLNSVAYAQQEAKSPAEVIGLAAASAVACFAEAKIELAAGDLLGNFTSFLKSRGLSAITSTVDPTNIFGSEVPVKAQGVEDRIVALSDSNSTNEAFALSKNCFRDVLAKILLDWIVDETIRWINGEGDPRYVGNWENFAEDAFNVGVGEVIGETIPALCSPFQLQVEAILTATPRFQNEIQCTFDTVVGNLDTFYDDFLSGGWLGYREVWQPQNNLFGVMLRAQDEALRRGSQKAEAAVNEAVASGGYLSQKRCKAGTAVTPSDPSATADLISRGYVRDDKGDYCASRDLEVLTPGDTVGVTVAAAVTSDSQWAANIQSWAAALINAAFNRLTKEGIRYAQDALTDVGDDEGTFSPSEALDQSLEVSLRVNFTEDAVTIPYGSAATITWLVRGGDGDVSCTASGSSAWNGSITQRTGTRASGVITAPVTFLLTCTDDAGDTVSDSVSVSAEFPDVDLKINDLDGPTVTASLGGQIELSWETTAVSACSAESTGGGVLGVWSGAKPLSGSEIVSDLVVSRTYTLECSDYTGTIHRDSITVNVF